MPDGGPTRVFNITIAGKGITVPCPETERVLMAIEAATPFPQPTPVNVGCRRGGCGACRIKVLKGSYETLKMSRAHVSETEEAEGYALACRISPTSDLTIETAFVTPHERAEMRREMALQN